MWFIAFPARERYAHGLRVSMCALFFVLTLPLRLHGYLSGMSGELALD